MHWLAGLILIAWRKSARASLTIFFLCLPAGGQTRERLAPVWVVSNGFHTSLAFRVRDVPYADQIEGGAHAKSLLIGWGAGDFYRGKVNPWTFIEALCGIGSSLLHVVPVRGAVGERFQHSDVVEFHLPISKVRTLTVEIDRAFARQPNGARMDVGRGYYRDSRFYLSAERFYFPYMCNTWVALKLGRSGTPIFVPTAIVAAYLIRQAAKFGHTLQHRSTPADAF